MRYLVVAFCGCLWLTACNRSNNALQNGDGGGSGGPTFDPCVANPKPGYDPSSKGLKTCCDVGPAHCVPSSDVLASLASELSACPDGSSVCMPDTIIRGGGQYMPAPCTSSVGNAAGVCLSQCIPLVSTNPEAALLGQDGCGDGELCIPCLNPLNGTSTGACDLVTLLCSTNDGGTDAGGDGGGQTCPYTGPPLIDPNTLAGCSPSCGGAHCIPASLVPAAQQSLLSACTASGGSPGFCAPDQLIETGGNFLPTSCTSVAGSEGRCLSACLPSVAAEASVLPVDVCGENEKCVPCFNPTASDPTAPTGACNLSCDKPTKPPVVLTCPYTGPNVVDPSQFPACDPSCDGSHCVPSALVPAAEQALLAPCNGGAGFCTPDSLVVGGGESVPKSCHSIGGSEGRCLSTCLPPIAAEASLLPVDVCAQGEVCAPCFDPTQPSPQPATGACTLACDKPAEAPLQIACPYTGDNLIDPKQFADCSSETCSNAHCLPAALVPAAQQALLAPCPGGGFCAPDEIIGSINHFVPKTCTSLAGEEGRCISTCLPSVAAEASLLPTTGCEDQPGTVCAPCFDPTGSMPTTPTGACSIGCDMPVHSPSPTPIACPYTGPDIIKPTLFPNCASATCSNAHCLPADLVPAAEQALLSPCAGGGFCTPDTIIGSVNHFVPKTCVSIAGAEGRCISTCLPSVAALSSVLPTTGCEDQPGTVCAPCFNPTATDPTTPTGACSLACDKPDPKQPPVILTCPWPVAPAPNPKPDVIVPGSLPGCGCNGAHCLPSAAVPTADQSQLNTCTGGFCTPDEIIATGGNFKPAGCIPFAGVSTNTEGRCLSDCLKAVSANATLEQSSCAANLEKCAPCADPFTGADTGACHLSSCDAAPVKPFTFPTCCVNAGVIGGRCVPTSQIPAAEQSNLGADVCSNVNANYLCVPNEQLPSPYGTTGQSCSVGFTIIPPFSYSGTCLSNCLSLGLGELYPQSSCPANHTCIPCSDAPAGSPGC